MDGTLITTKTELPHTPSYFEFDMDLTPGQQYAVYMKAVSGGQNSLQGFDSAYTGMIDPLSDI